MLRRTLLVTILSALYIPLAWGAEPASDQPYQDLSGKWTGTMNGSLVGDCSSAEGRVHKVTVVIEVDEKGAFKAVCEHCPVFHPNMGALSPIIGFVDEDLSITASQGFVFLEIRSDEDIGPVISKTHWSGNISHKKKVLKLHMTSHIRIRTSTSTTCIIYGTFRLSRPRRQVADPSQ
jgi:hypothetical protein